MFDYHMHSTVSFDGLSDAREMVQAALDRGLKEICFTDHIDHEANVEKEIMVFDFDKYSAAYDDLHVSGLKLRRGVEYGLKPGNQAQMQEELARRPFDFVIGSIHLIDEEDVYLQPF